MEIGKALLVGAAIAGGIYAASKMLGDDGMSSLTEAAEDIADAVIDGSIDPDDLFDEVVDGVSDIDMGLGSLL